MAMDQTAAPGLPGDIFGTTSGWEVIASGEAFGRVAAGPGPSRGRVWRLEYDFKSGGGFVVARLPFRAVLPESFAFVARWRGMGPANHFEWKVVSAGGEDVWRHRREAVPWPREWEELRITERELPFAWGPGGGGTPGEISAIEVAITAGPGGAGFVELTDAAFHDESFQQPAAVMASSRQPGRDPTRVFGDGFWEAAPEDPTPWWMVDLGRTHRFGGLILRWPDDRHGRGFTLSNSIDGKTWSVSKVAEDARGDWTPIAVPGGEARYLRLGFASATGAGLQGLELQPDGFSSSPNAFLHAVAARFPRGWFPRYWRREQSYWTPVGYPDGGKRALLNEEGMVEVDEGSFSLEPFLVRDGKWTTWADAGCRVFLPEDGGPRPGVEWPVAGGHLRVLPEAVLSGKSRVLRVCYEVRPPPGARWHLAVAARPYQVNPPWQQFRNLGGRATLRKITTGCDSGAIDGKALRFSRPADDWGAATFEQGGGLPGLSRGEAPASEACDDADGLGTGVWLWEVPEHGFEVQVSWDWECESENAEGWESAIHRVHWQLPESIMDAARAFHTCSAHILINRDGAGMQPGPRRYTRSWIRDCVIMGAALAKAGRPEPLRAFLFWYAGFQRDDGFVPCVVDRDGVDWLVEHDSHGQFLWAARECLRHGLPREALTGLRPQLRKAAEYLAELRATRMGEEFQSGEHADRRGLLPESASHEGYLAHPVHSYWDDFWGIRGLEAMAEIELGAGKPEEAARWRNEAGRLRESTFASMRAVIAKHQLGHLPGSVEWADFDPTATANAIGLLDFADALPRDEMHRMFDTYLEGFRKKHDGTMPWTNYTPYEIRIIGALARIGRREEANELLRFFLSDRRPLEWNQWPEIAWKDPRAPGHLGDVPHTWISAEYMIAFASLFVHECEELDRFLLAQGLPWEWVAAPGGVGVKGLPVRYGVIDLGLETEGERNCRIRIGGDFAFPAGGLLLLPPAPPGFHATNARSDMGRELPLAPGGTGFLLDAPLANVVVRFGETNCRHPDPACLDA
jgi:hypothetical protein